MTRRPRRSSRRAWRSGESWATSAASRSLSTAWGASPSAVAGGQGDQERAARLFGAAAALRASLHVALTPAEHALSALSAAAVRLALGEEAFMTYWGEGERLTLEQALRLAVAEPVPR